MNIHICFYVLLSITCRKHVYQTIWPFLSRLVKLFVAPTLRVHLQGEQTHLSNWYGNWPKSSIHHHSIYLERNKGIGKADIMAGRPTPPNVPPPEIRPYSGPLNHWFPSSLMKTSHKHRIQKCWSWLVSWPWNQMILKVWRQQKPGFSSLECRGEIGGRCDFLSNVKDGDVIGSASEDSSCVFDTTLMVRKSGEKTTVWMVLKPCKSWVKQLPTSTGEFAGFLNHQQ